MTNVLVAGDLHGHRPSLLALLGEANEKGIERIIQVGDFGFLFQPGVVTPLQNISRDLMDAGVTLDFCDGNHENFDLLADLGASPDGTDPVEIARNVTYWPRGSRTEIDGAKVMFFGGAFSIDRDYRQTQMHMGAPKQWWSQERITKQQVLRVMRNPEPVDILFSHDAPDWPMGKLDRQLQSFTMPLKLDAKSRENRALLRNVYDTVKPSLVIHGHYHWSYRDRLPHGEVYGLACNDMEGSSVVLDIEAWMAADHG